LQTEFSYIAAWGSNNKYYVAFFLKNYNQALKFYQPDKSEDLLVCQLSNFSTSLRKAGTLDFARGISLFLVGATSFENSFKL
jgi:hypothetical protein